MASAVYPKAEWNAQNQRGKKEKPQKTPTATL
jgi:hypothetical protein